MGRRLAVVRAWLATAVTSRPERGDNGEIASEAALIAAMVALAAVIAAGVYAAVEGINFNIELPD